MKKIWLKCPNRTLMFALLLLTVYTTPLQADTAKDLKISLSMENVPVRLVMNELEKKTRLTFFYSSGTIDTRRRVDIRLKDASLEDAIRDLFAGTGITYRISGRQIILEKKQIIGTDLGKTPDPSQLRTWSGMNSDLERREAAFIPVVQEKTVTGTVTDAETGESLPGVSVVLKGTAIGTTTDTDGVYRLEIPGPGPENTLEFSFLGYLTWEAAVGNRSTVDVALKKDVMGLEEVVVVGYGAVKKSDLTGSVSQIKTEDLQAVPVYSVEQALKARAAGVQVTQNSGQPGGRIEVRVRGGNSMIGDNQPLYVVDGFPVTGGINFLNPADIESIDILKDASATAIYGARGANGVVIITSKRGKAGQKSRIEVHSSYGVQEETNRYDLLNAREYAEIANEWLKNAGQDPFFNINEIENPGTDWQDAVLRSAPIQDHTISFSGSSEKTRYAVSGNYYDQEGIIINSGVKRGSARLNLDHELNSWLHMAVNLNLSRRERLRVPVDNGYRGNNSVLSAAASAPPTLPVYDEEGLPTQIEKFYNFGSADMRNPMIFSEDQTRNLANTVIGNTTLEVSLTKDLSFKTLLGMEYVDTLADRFVPIIFESDRGFAQQENSYRSSFLNENTLTYSRDFGAEHSLTATGGFTYQTNKYRNSGISASGLSGNTTRNYDLSAAETINTPWSGISEWVLASWLARANYVFKDKYLVTASIRADGSSRFGSNNKWAVFPSAALAWRVSEEPFMKNVRLISDLKIRTSYGVTGNTALDPYQSLDRMEAYRTIYANQEELVGYSPSGISNDDLKWETTTQIDVGLDFGILDNRLRITADYYRKNTTNLLASVPLPPSVGFGSILQNIGEIQNQGFEFAVDADILRRRLSWNVVASLSTNRNKVIEIAGGSDILSSGQTAVWSSTNIAREGEPLGSLYGYVEDGLDENGFIRYKDTDGNGTINTLDKVILGNPHPDFFYGLNSNLSYKRVQLNIFLEGVHGNQLFNATNGTHLNSFQRGNNQFRDIIGNYWTAENPDPNAKYPKISSQTASDVSDRFVEDGSYLRVKSLRIAYDLPVKKWGMPWFSLAQVYLSGINLFTFTDYTGLDPEVNTRGDDSQNVGNRLRMGYDQSAYPNAKTYMIGLKLTF